MTRPLPISNKPHRSLAATAGTCACVFFLSQHSADAFRAATPSPLQRGTALRAVKTQSGDARLKRTSALTDWAKDNGIKFGGVEVTSGMDDNSGLGLFGSQELAPKDVIVEVPTKMLLSVATPQDYNKACEDLFPVDKKAYRNAPWWAALSVQVNGYDKIDPTNPRAENTSMKPWLDSLPRKFDTPLHWSPSTIDDLQYRAMSEAVSIQKRVWADEYAKLTAASGPTGPFASRVSYEEFVWGCETARSRAFSGAYSGSAFNPIPYALTLVLVAAYVGLGLGSTEQAANGAALVFCGTILKDFVFPKLLKVQKYIICPFIDMANHVGTGQRGDVAFEYFTDGFSLSVMDGPTIGAGKEVFINYGPRNNDQLLQYYGFVEKNNVHDVYIMPPLREWDIGALEDATGRTIRPGRLEKLDRAGLLGFERRPDAAISSSSGEAANDIGGVVLTRAGGIDPAVIQALRALLSTDEEWDEAGEAIGNFAEEASSANERAARMAVRMAMEMELSAKPTTRGEDEVLLQTLESRNEDQEDILAVKFRIEKKKLLEEAIKKY